MRSHHWQRVLTLNMPTKNAYDSISIHGGSGFIMEYKCQRLYRDARIFSIYEGTTQLQVVAAVRYITNGTYLSIMKKCWKRGLRLYERLKSSCSNLIAQYEEALEKVKASECQDTIDFLARRFVQ